MRGHEKTPGEPAPAAARGFPVGWERWRALPEVPHPESSEVRQVHVPSGVEGLPAPVGTVLVKAHYRLAAGGARGSLFQLSVMRKTGEGRYGGWAFEAYDPVTRQKRPTDPDVCVLCHQQRADHDYVFSGLGGP